MLNYYDVVEVVVNNFDTGGHPLHLHGHNFQIVQRSAADAGVYGGNPINPPATPIRRDVVKVNEGGYVTFRFIADNPDKYLHYPDSTLGTFGLRRIYTCLGIPLPYRLAPYSRLLRNLRGGTFAAAIAKCSRRSISGVQRPRPAVPGQCSGQHKELHGS